MSKQPRCYRVFYNCLAAAIITEALLLFGLYLVTDKEFHIPASVFGGLIIYNLAAAHIVKRHWRIQRMRKRYRETKKNNENLLYERYPHLRPEPQNQLEIN